MVALHHGLDTVRRRRSRDTVIGRPVNWRMLIGLTGTAVFWAWIIQLAPRFF